MKIDLSQLITADDKAIAAQDSARAEIASRRWEAENSGIQIGGMHVHTDERTRTNILGAYQEALEDPGFTVLWKGADGQFAPLDSPTIIAVAKAIRHHVQACFIREADLLTALEAGQPYDIETGWP